MGEQGNHKKHYKIYEINKKENTTKQTHGMQQKHCLKGNLYL